MVTTCCSQKMIPIPSSVSHGVLGLRLAEKVGLPGLVEVHLSREDHTVPLGTQFVHGPNFGIDEARECFTWLNSIEFGGGADYNYAS